MSGKDVVDRIDLAVREHTGTAEQHDDVTMLALHRPRAARGRARTARATGWWRR